ncbi:hypothetical protein PIL02S_04515 [Paenibacillus illinoisensis]|uniref:Uncharacterized protein n=1 Tax=Paenibacillus illinoisensis TaxID=59845 RepID=A0A2W0CCG5_9BACL|nr:hypothetical protein PIL02S_04515 [Paenibacillus illinoisensis]
MNIHQCLKYWTFKFGVSYFLDISSVEGGMTEGIKKPCDLRKQGSHGSIYLLHCGQSNQERESLII